MRFGMNHCVRVDVFMPREDKQARIGLNNSKKRRVSQIHF